MKGGTPERQQGHGTLAAPGAAAARRLPRGYGQRPWRSQRPQRPTDIICHRSPTLVQEAPHRTGANPQHSHASRARAIDSASHGAPADSRRNPELVCRLPPWVGSRPAAGGTARRGHTAKGTRGRPTACTGGGGTTPPAPPPPRARRGDTGPGHGQRPPDQLGPYTTGFPTPAATQPNRRGAEDAP